MSSKQIKIEDYFNIMRDDNGRVFGIQEIGDTRDLIKAIEEQNEYIKTKEQECEELNSDNRYFVNKIISLELLTDKYEQAIGKIEDIADDYNRIEKTSQYYRDGFDEIQNIIDEIKEGNNDG